jgi:excinuclease ABC subunit A
MGNAWLIVTGARQHNLKNITVRIPRQALTVVTGLSGSGKSSLVFDTLYAEGQRRYVESLSAYARQFLDRFQKPAVDAIEGLSPALAIEQRSGAPNPRSTVATVTEIHDYLRLIFAALATRHCPTCGSPVRRQTPEQMATHLLALPSGTRLHLLAPVPETIALGALRALELLRRRGYLRARVNGQIGELEHLTLPAATSAPPRIEVVVDRLAIEPGLRSRLTDSIELALREGDGRLTALVERAGSPPEEIHFSEKNACLTCQRAFEDLSPSHFSFNSPHGACPACLGLGVRPVFDESRVVPDPSRSLRQGAIQAWRRGGRRLILYYNTLLRGLAKQFGFSLDTPYQDLPGDVRHLLMKGSGEETVETVRWSRGAWRKSRKPFEGVLPNLERRLRETDSESVRQALRRYQVRQPCDACGGRRLRPEVLACRLRDRTIAEVTALSVREALAFFQKAAWTADEMARAGEAIRETEHRLRLLAQVGVDYLTLDRETHTLSGGEAQRVRLASQIGSRLSGVLYVLDEPSVGLHARDHDRLLRVLTGLRDLGNTVIVVEHDEMTIRRADYVVDLGPGAGRHGGEVVACGTPVEVLSSPASLTAQYLNGLRRIPVPQVRRTPGDGWLVVEGAAEHNLKGIDVRLPLGLFVCVTGVSGSGKSTLVDDILCRALARRLYGAEEPPGRHRTLRGVERITQLIRIDQSPIGRTPRSNPATYTGAWDEIRALFAALPAARVRGYGPSRFSFNVKGGRCEVCKGEGLLRIEMQFLPDVYISCEACHGRRFNRETLEIRYRDRTIADILEMTVEEALDFFDAVPALARKLQTLAEAGLGYLQLGQPATTLSGGEAQRIKLSAELSRRTSGHTLYVLDEPTTGLHAADVARLLTILFRLRDSGHTVLVIEHHLDVIKSADYIIDLGPEGGDAGGWIVAQGTPEEVAACSASHTGVWLKKVLTRS